MIKAVNVALEYYSYAMFRASNDQIENSRTCYPKVLKSQQRSLEYLCLIRLNKYCNVDCKANYGRNSHT